MAAAFVMELVGLSPAWGPSLLASSWRTANTATNWKATLNPSRDPPQPVFHLRWASINFGLILNRPLTVVALVFGILVIKSAVLFLTGN